MSADTVSVLLVDDNHIVRSGLRLLLEGCDDLAVVGEAANGTECIAAVDELGPDVVILDVRMPGSIDGIVTASQISDRTHVLMMTNNDDEATVRGALEAGAKGFLVHGDASADEVISAVRAVASGRTQLGGRAGELVVQMMAGGSTVTAPTVRQEGPRSNLTEREVEIIGLMCQGLSNGDIAGQLYISPSTLKNHITRIFDKLGVSTRAEAIVLWLRGADSQDLGAS